MFLSERQTVFFFEKDLADSIEHYHYLSDSVKMIQGLGIEMTKEQERMLAVRLSGGVMTYTNKVKSDIAEMFLKRVRASQQEKDDDNKAPRITF